VNRAALVALLAVVTAAPALARAELDPPPTARAIAGVVVDAATGAPIAGAAVSAGADAATSGPDGHFTLPANGGELFVMADGYLPLTIAAPGHGALRIELSTEVADGEIIEVTGRAPDLVRTTGYHLDAARIRALPGAGNDVLRAVQALPGVTRMSYGMGGLILRGARTADTQVFVDGIETPLAFHFGGLASVIPSTLVEDLTVTPGGGDVAWGRGTGGVVEIATRAGRRDRWRAGGELGLLDAGATAEGPLPGGGAVAVGLRRSYAGEIIDAVAPSEYRYLARYHDAQLRVDLPVGGGALTALAFVATDRVTRAEEVDIAQQFARAGLRYRRRVGATLLTALAWTGWRAFDIDLDLPDQEDGVSTLQRQSMVPAGLRLDARRDTGWGHVAAGIDLERTRYGEALARDGDEPDRMTPPHAMSQLGAWVEARWRIADGKLNLKPGVRVDHLSASAAWVVEPRATVSHELAPWLTLREGLSVHRQPPVPMNVVDDEGDRIVVAPTRGVHASVGADLHLPAAIEVSLSAYQNQSAGPRTPHDDDFTTIVNLAGIGVVIENLVGNELGNGGGRQRSRGLELSLLRARERWTTSIAYTLARTERHSSELGWQVTPLDQTHTLDASAGVALGAWSLGARARIATGMPLPPEVVFGDDGEVAPAPFRGRLRTFASLDLRVERRWRRPWGTVAGFLDVQNVTNRANQESAGGLGGDAAPGLPVFPSFGVSFVPPA
jgi:hypothetical protein